MLSFALWTGLSSDFQVVTLKPVPDYQIIVKYCMDILFMGQGSILSILVSLSGV